MDEEKLQGATAITTAEYNKLREKADKLDELLVIYKRHYGNVIEYTLELQEKAKKLELIKELVSHLSLQSDSAMWRIRRILGVED